MTERPHLSQVPNRAFLAGALLLSMALGGCAGLGDSGVSAAFVDPARYDLYDCKQLETERKSLATQRKQINDLIAKAETGAGGAVVAEVAYRNSYISVQAQSKLADEVWARNKCDRPSAEAMPAPPPMGARAPLRSGSAVY